MTNNCPHPDHRRISCGREFLWCARCGAMRRIAPAYLWQLPGEGGDDMKKKKSGERGGK